MVTVLYWGSNDEKKICTYLIWSNFSQHDTDFSWSLKLEMATWNLFLFYCGGIPRGPNRVSCYNPASPELALLSSPTPNLCMILSLASWMLGLQVGATTSDSYGHLRRFETFFFLGNRMPVLDVAVEETAFPLQSREGNEMWTELLRWASEESPFENGWLK